MQLIVATQSNTGPNGEFIMGKTSHVLFAKMDDSILCDIEGKELNVSSYKELEQIPKLQTITSILDNLFTLKGIKCQISKITSNLFSSIFEIKDTGVPVNSKSTQDPTLDNCYQSIIEIPPKRLLNTMGEHDVETCPCCKFYTMTSSTKTSDVVEDNIAKDYLKSNEKASLLNNQLVTSTQKQISSEVKDKAEDNVAEKFDKILSSSSQNDVPQDIICLSKKDIRNEHITIEFIEENENNNIKISSKSLVDGNKSCIAEFAEYTKADHDTRSSDTIHNKTVTNQNIKVWSDNVTNDNASGEMVQSEALNKTSKMIQLHHTDLNFIEKHSERNLSRDIQNKILEDAAVHEKKANEIISNLTTYNEKRNNIVNTSQRASSDPLYSCLPSESSCTTYKNDDVVKDMRAQQYQLNYNVSEKLTQKPSINKNALNNLQKPELRSGKRNAISFENIKLHVKKSFRKTSSALSVLFNCVDIKSGSNIRNSKHTNDNNYHLSKDEKFLDNPHDNLVLVLGDSDKKDSKVSEEEMFSLQYNSKIVIDAESSGIQRNIFN